MTEDAASAVATISDSLLQLPLFDGCSRDALEAAARRAQVETLASGEELTLPERKVFVVLAGCAQVRAGVGPLSVMRRGCTLNASSLLTGARAEPPWPILTSEPCKATVDGMEATCIPNLCPHTPMATAEPNRPNSGRGHGQLAVPIAPRCSSKRIPLVSGGPPDTESIGDDSECGGAVLAALSLELLEDSLETGGSLKRFHANRDQLLDRWSVIVRSTLLPGASNEILFAVTEVADRSFVEADQLLVKETEMDSSIILVDQGEAVVEKKVVSRDGKTVDTLSIGRISRGAVIGDATLVCAKVSRCATVRATTPMVVITVQPMCLLRVLRRFPGTTTCIEERIKEIVGLLAEALPQKLEVLSSVKLFASSDSMFLQAMAGAAERHVYYCGDVLKREGRPDGTLYVVEFGACTVEASRLNGGILEAEITVGSCMGERTLLGAENANATVRVATPMAMMLTVSQSAFNSTLRRFPWDGQRFQNFRELPGAAARNHDAGSLKIFQGSSHEFVREISEAMAIRCFMPGQTVIVQGTADAGQMFAIKGGRVTIEIDGRPCHKLVTGDVFGELAMVGVVRRRSSTVRAMTFCIMLEIPREAFLASLDRHPRERQRFESFATHHEVAASSIQWPILRNMPSQLLYVVNLYAERRICAAEDTSLSLPATRDAAIMCMQGALKIMGPNGEDLEQEVHEGECFNEQALLGLPSGQYLMPKSTCEVQIITKDVWEKKVLAEFPEHKDEAKTNILKEMAGKAQAKLEGSRSGLNMLRRSALFRSMSAEMAEKVMSSLEERIYQPDELITEEFSKDDSMFWVLMGSVKVTESIANSAARKPKASRPGTPASVWTWEVHAGQVLSESVAVGIYDAQPYTIRASNICLLQTISRRQINALLTEFPKDKWAFSAVQEETKLAAANMSLQDSIMRSPFFAKMKKEVAVALCERCEDVFFAPSEEIFTRGEECDFGNSCMYVLLAGQAIVESNIGIVMGRVTAGEVMGEAGAFGFAARRGATVRSWGGGLVHCAKLQGPIVKAVALKYPESCQAVRDLFKQRANDNKAFQENKQQWLEETVGPALARSPIFAGISKAAIDEIAKMSACLATYTAGKNITEAGQPADSMLLLLEGIVEVQTQTGKAVGTATTGAMFGEVCLLGLLMLRTATICTRVNSKVLTITKDTVETCLAKSSNVASREAFERNKQARLEQVAKGFPICGMPSINEPKEDICIRTLSLQAERIQLQAGAIWHPISDNSPCGPYYGFLVKGHAMLQNPEEERPVMALPEGCVIYEGLVTKHGAHIRAVTACEAYRIRQTDFELAVRLSHAGCPWYCTFLMLLKESRRHMSARLQSARGALDGGQPKKKDTEIRLWRLDREMSIDHAGRMKSYHQQAENRRQRQEMMRANGLMGAGGACLRRGSTSSIIRRSSSATNVSMSRISRHSSLIDGQAVAAAVLNRYPESGCIMKALPQSLSASRLREKDYGPQAWNASPTGSPKSFPSPSREQSESDGHLPDIASPSASPKRRPADL